MRLALYGYAAVASHEIISWKYDALDAHRVELEKHVGKAEAMRAVIEIYYEGVGIACRAACPSPGVVGSGYHRMTLNTMTIPSPSTKNNTAIGTSTASVALTPLRR